MPEKAGFGRFSSSLLAFMLSFCALLQSAIVLADGVHKGLVLGVYPSLSTISLMKRYMPLRDYLSQQLDQSVYLETAPDVDSFVRRTARGDYDLVLTAPHFGLEALDSGHYIAIAQTAKPLRIGIVVRADSRWHTLKELAGRRIALPARTTLAAEVTRTYLRQQGLTGNHTPILHHYETHNAAYEAVLAGEADAAAVSMTVFQRALVAHNDLHCLRELPGHFPGMLVLASQRMSASLRQAVQQSLTSMKEEPRGRPVLSALGYAGYEQPDLGQYRILQRYLGYGVGHGGPAP